jgi:uncharacterized protein (TIGR02611 family)
MASLYRRGRRAGVAVLGGAVLFVGIIAIPYPGPGWLIVFAGLGILSTEFEWAKRVLGFARAKYDAWQDWLRCQSVMVKVAFWLLTAMVVVLTIWLLNGYGLINGLLDLGLDWAQSPFVK